MAAKKQEFVRVDGQIARTERVAGSFTGQDGSNVQYDYTEVRVLSDDADVAHVRFPSDGNGRPLVAIPERGARVSLLCEARSAGGNVRLEVKRVDLGTYEDHATGVLAAV